MCLACVGAATPEVAVAIGSYAAVRFGRPLERIDALRQSGRDDAEASEPGDVSARDDAADPAESALSTSTA